MSNLSNVDIIRELGDNILIYPLEINNIKGNTVNLTASEFAWRLSDKKSIANNGKIIIPAGDTALIETKEVIYVTNKIGGTYHSKVKLVSSGLGHIGTTLDPEFIGPSLIALHNHSKEIYELNVGDTFVSIMFHYLNTKSTKSNTNTPGQREVLDGYGLTYDATKWLDLDWVKDRKELKTRLIHSDEYKNLKSTQRYQNNIVVKYIIFFVILCLVYYIDGRGWIKAPLTGIIFGIIVTNFVNDLNNRK